ncbi:MAG: hypothetical protein ACI3XW_03960 [Butyricicoccus sp.]
MKIHRLFSIIWAVCLCFALTACKGSALQDESVSDTAPEITEVAQVEKQKIVEIDLDLTKLSSTMVYAEVYNMITSPEEYIGRIVRMDGTFTIYQAIDDYGQVIPDTLYFACVIADATACCAQGIEFVLEGNYSYPDDYPELGSDITITGEFQTYEENGHTFVHLVDAALET